MAFNICANPATKSGFRIIWRAAKTGDLDLVRILIREGQEVNEATQDRRNTALHLAAKHGHILVVKYLLEQKASPKLVNAEGKTAYDFAVEALAAVKPKVKTNKEGKPLKQPKSEKGCLLDRLTVTEKTLSEY